MSRRVLAGVLAAVVLGASGACTSPISIGGAQGDGVREDDTADLLELSGVEHALVSTDPVEDSDYSITRAVVDLAPDADVEQVAGALEAVAELEAVDGAAWLTVGAGRAELDEYGDLVVPEEPVPTVDGRLEDPDAAERVATALVQGTELSGTAAQVYLGEDDIELRVTAADGPAALAELALRATAAGYLAADRVTVMGEGTLRLASGEQVVDARAVQVLLEMQQDQPTLPPWMQAWAPVVGTEYDRVVVERILSVTDRAPRSVAREERRAVTRWLEHVLDAAARLPTSSEVGIRSQPEGRRDPLDLDVDVMVPGRGAAPRDREGDPWLDAARAYLYDRVQNPRVRRTS
ncbi:hypothetical protein [Nocardioides nanhaiensis]|uniref:GerMN domain-containing protein n=1 Tax=Nocardioides nanhaiensis TaxID=1476871 RepID=A0ABP8X5N0_9ACTN